MYTVSKNLIPTFIGNSLRIWIIMKKRQCSIHEQKSIFWKEFLSADHNIEFRDNALSFIMAVL